MENDNQVTVFSDQVDELAIKHLAALNAFTTIYEAKNPRPVQTAVQRDMVSMIIIAALTLVMIAAVIVSGSRTVAEFGGDKGNWQTAIGWFAFAMIEGGIMAYAFFRARRTTSKRRIEDTLKWATGGLVLTVVVGVGANIDATLHAHGIGLPNEVLVILNLLVAVSAPALGFISADVLAIELMAMDFKRAEALKADAIKLKAWQKGLNTEWKRQQGNWGVRIRVEQPQTPQLTDRNSPDFTKFHEKSVKPRVRINEIAAQIAENGDENLSVIEMMDKYQISAGSTTKIRELLKIQSQ